MNYYSIQAAVMSVGVSTSLHESFEDLHTAILNFVSSYRNGRTAVIN